MAHDRKELLTNAAKAAGYEIWWKTGSCKGGEFEAAFIGDKPWNPIASTGDALQLAIDASMNRDFGMVIYLPNIDDQTCVVRKDDEGINEMEVVEDSPVSCVCLAITLAAAKLGKAMHG